MKRMTSAIYLVAIAVVGGLLAPATVFADPLKRIGGHIGFVVPMVSRSGGQTTTVADDFVIGFPVGIALTHFGRYTLDLEVVPVVQNRPSALSMELHPGLVTSVGHDFAAGVRAAFDVQGKSFGFTPLLNRAIYHARTHSLFGEVVVPVRFVDGVRTRQTSVGLGVHIGIGF